MLLLRQKSWRVMVADNPWYVFQCSLGMRALLPLYSLNLVLGLQPVNIS